LKTIEQPCSDSAI